MEKPTNGGESSLWFCPTIKNRFFFCTDSIMVKSSPFWWHHLGEDLLGLFPGIVFQSQIPMGFYPWDHHGITINLGIHFFWGARIFQASKNRRKSFPGLHCFVTERWSKNVRRFGLEVKKRLKMQFAQKSWRFWWWFWVKRSLQIDGFLVWLLHYFGLLWTFQLVSAIGSLFLPYFGRTSHWPLCLRVWWYGWWLFQASKMFWSSFASSHVRKAELCALRYLRIGWSSSQLPFCFVSSLHSMLFLAF